MKRCLRVESNLDHLQQAFSMGTANTYDLGARDQLGVRTFGNTGECLRQSKDDNIQDEFKVSHSSSYSVVIADHTRVRV